MTYIKCLLDGKVNLHWFHHQIHPDIRMIFHKHQNVITHVTLIVPDELVEFYLSRLREQYCIDNLALLVSVHLFHIKLNTE